LGRRVALKVLPFAATLDARQLQRFKNEAHAAAFLHHQHIVPVYSVGCERGVHYYAMQYIDGQTLAAVIQEFRRLAGQPVEEESSPAPPAPDLARDLPSGRWPRGPRASAAATPTAPYVLPPQSTPRSALSTTPPVAGLSTEGSVKTAAYFRTLANLG